MFTQLEFKRCTGLIVRQHWFMGECRGEADVLYLEIDGRDWFALAYDPRKQAFTVTPSSYDEAHSVYGSGDSRHPVKDIGKACHLDACMISRIDQKPLGNGAELCLVLDNATDITIHYNTVTGGSSLYITHD